MSELAELSRKKRRRRPTPLRELDQRARRARLKLEQEIYRPHLVRLDLRVTPERLARIDAERRVVDVRGVPSRAVLFRALVDVALIHAAEEQRSCSARRALSDRHLRAFGLA